VDSSLRYRPVTLATADQPAVDGKARWQPDDKGRGAALGHQVVVVIVAKSGSFDDGITLYDAQLCPDKRYTEQASLAPFPVCRCNRASTGGIPAGALYRRRAIHLINRDENPPG
jgi:hypothetical protein